MKGKSWKITSRLMVTIRGPFWERRQKAKVTVKLKYNQLAAENVLFPSSKWSPIFAHIPANWGQFLTRRVSQIGFIFISFFYRICISLVPKCRSNLLPTFYFSRRLLFAIGIAMPNDVSVMYFLRKK